VLVTCLAVFAGLVGACGNRSAAPGVAGEGRSSSVPTTVAASSATTLPTAASIKAVIKFAACVREHGLSKFPDPPYSDGELNEMGFTKTVVDKYANGACHKDALAAGVVQSAAGLAQHLQQMLKISQCMRSHGISNFPDPGPQGGIGMPPSVADEPGYTAAAKACGAPPDPVQAKRGGG
jgi:hypothetical protein